VLRVGTGKRTRLTGRSSSTRHTRDTPNSSTPHRTRHLLARRVRA